LFQNYSEAFSTNHLFKACQAPFFLIADLSKTLNCLHPPFSLNCIKRETMKNVMLFSLICMVQILCAQDNYEMLKMKLEKEYPFEQVGDYIDLAKKLPIAVPLGERDSAEWIQSRKQSTELYLLWYKGMSNLGYKMDDKALYLHTQNEPDTIETPEQLNTRLTENTKVRYKKQAVSTFLIAEQRLKMFVKDAYKKKRRKMFKVELYQFGEPYEELSDLIMREIVDSSFGFVLYENNIRKRQEKEIIEEEITVKN